jgi:hypothetical protein
VKRLLLVLALLAPTPALAIPSECQKNFGKVDIEQVKRARIVAANWSRMVIKNDVDNQRKIAGYLIYMYESDPVPVQVAVCGYDIAPSQFMADIRRAYQAPARVVREAPAPAPRRQQYTECVQLGIISRCVTD